MDLQKEKELLRKAQKGESEAYAELISYFQERLYRRAIALLGNPDTAQDVLQSTFIAAYRFLKKFRGDSSVYTWLYRILSNKCRDHLQKQGRNNSFNLETWDPILKDERINLQKNIELSESSHYLIAKVNALPVKYRKIILYRYYDNLKYARIAELLRIKEGTVKSRLSKARDLLRGYIMRDGRKQELLED